jgi:hypothetical protein
MNGTVELPIGPNKLFFPQRVRLGCARDRTVADQLHPQRFQRDPDVCTARHIPLLREPRIPDREQQLEIAKTEL